MRAKMVPRRAVCFDFDDTLFKTKGKTHIYKDGRKIRSLTPDELNRYEIKPGEILDTSDFRDPLLILSAEKYKMWPALERLYFSKLQGRENADIYILTAREPVARMPIYTLLKRNGIEIPEDHIITVGRADNLQSVASDKKEVLQKLKDEYGSVLFYDDSEDNIRLAGEIGGVETILVDWNK